MSLGLAVASLLLVAVGTSALQCYKFSLSTMTNGVPNADYEIVECEGSCFKISTDFGQQFVGGCAAAADPLARLLVVSVEFRSGRMTIDTNAWVDVDKAEREECCVNGFIQPPRVSDGFSESYVQLYAHTYPFHAVRQAVTKEFCGAVEMKVADFGSACTQDVMQFKADLYTEPWEDTFLCDHYMDKTCPAYTHGVQSWVADSADCTDTCFCSIVSSEIVSSESVKVFEYSGSCVAFPASTNTTNDADAAVLAWEGLSPSEGNTFEARLTDEQNTIQFPSLRVKKESITLNSFNCKYGVDVSM